MPDEPLAGTLGLVRLRCVIVDDDKEFLRVAQTLLERDGVTVAGVAHNSAEALSAPGSCDRTSC
jgi:CheY-like chemotaxis protein